jgi:hypothetical protein
MISCNDIICKCQACEKPGIALWDICEDCGWENDDTFEVYHSADLSADLIEVVSVGYV